jgi:hypothetical protein
MEPGRYPTDVANGDIRWERPVQGLHQPLSGERPRNGEGNHLPRGVHSGIGTSGAVYRLASSANEAGQRGFELPLDRPDPGPLGLKSGELRAVIFNRSPISDSRSR